MQIASEQAKIDQDRILRAIESVPDRMHFSDFEDSIILKYYISKGSRALAKILKKNKGQIQSRYRTLNNRLG